MLDDADTILSGCNKANSVKAVIRLASAGEEDNCGGSASFSPPIGPWLQSSAPIGRTTSDHIVTFTMKYGKDP